MSLLSSFLDLFSPEACQRYIHRLRWQDKSLQCPRCQSPQVRPWGKYHRKPGLERYVCDGCGRTFNDLTGTSFHRSRLSLAGWILAAFLLALCCTSRRIGRELGMWLCSTYHRVWLLRNLALSLEHDRKVEGTVEADEIYQTAGQKGQQPHSGGPKGLKRPPRSRGLKKGPGRGHFEKDTPCIIAWVARTGQVVLQVVCNFTTQTVQKAALRAVKPGSRIFTDSAGSYEGLSEVGFLHESVNHTQGEWVRGEVHENGAEGIFSLVRPSLAAFRGVSKELLPAYVGFFQFGRNHREVPAWQQAELILRQGLDPTLAQAAREGHFARAFTSSLLLHTAGI